MENGPNNRLVEIWRNLSDSANQFNAYKFFTNVEDVKEALANVELQTLEDYTGNSRADLEFLSPGVCDSYNTLVDELKRSEFNYERFQEILKEIWEIAHAK